MRAVPESLRLIGVLLAAGAIAGVGSLILLNDPDKGVAAAEVLTGGIVARGKIAIERRQCAACHVIPGIAGAKGQVGPSLDGVASRRTIAGLLRNDADGMILWLRHPQAVAPGNAMPDMGLTDREARDIAAYLYSLNEAPS
ncbi:cytochrome c class I [Sphingobium chlorophenolicum L-1]|uniref:Cytochrome c class I n=1 Tax=Sphingobium chlorophenolicum L-1 TaxID=690566 RepID=F6F3K6_SPHCR|nr:c-type cytochrome [Sphingobium chlorophenolicum]AEG51018.1 cytochrome c class I [Sphingobium chlorophenolicum L-1]